MVDLTRSFKSAPEVCAEDLPDKPYFVIVTADFTAMDVDEMTELARLLVDTQAMWVAAHGNGCSLFDDAVDMAGVLRNIELGAEQPLVMTTWHKEEPLTEVVEELNNYAPHEDWVGVTEWPLVLIKIDQFL